jgi:osmotically-inducible protein OsmY
LTRSLVITLFVASLATSLAPFARAQQKVPANPVEQIERQVRSAILALPFYNVFDDITYKVEDHKVTLMGDVTRPFLKQSAENVVKRIAGVREVNNRIEVLLPTGMDRELRLRLFRAIYEFPALQRYELSVLKPIRIIVKNGHVDLRGVVDSTEDKNMVGIRANSVSGIFSVTNNLKVVKP